MVETPTPLDSPIGWHIDSEVQVPKDHGIGSYK